jgi:hypothetical protein
MVESVPEKIIIEDTIPEQIRNKLSEAHEACHYLYQNLRGETLGLGGYSYLNSIYNQGASKNVKWSKCDHKLIHDLRDRILGGPVTPEEARERHFAFSSAYQHQNFDGFQKRAVDIACRALEGHDGIDAVVPTSGCLWRPVCQSHDATLNQNHFLRRQEIVVEFMPSQQTLWAFRPRTAEDQEAELKYDPSMFVHSTCIANVGSVTAMGLQAGAGQKSSSGQNQKPAVFMDEYDKFHRSTWYGPLCSVPSIPDVFVRVCYVFQVDSS